MPASGTAALGPIKSQIARLMIKVIRVSLKQRQSGAGGGGGWCVDFVVVSSSEGLSDSGVLVDG